MWFFRKKTPGEKIRNPIQGEFFATEAIEGPAQALIRESVQNSLDAALGTGLVRVRIYLASGNQALPASAVAPLFEGAWPHYEARGNGLQLLPSETDSCPFIVIEDFETRGLTGDIAQADPDPEVRNPFFLFFRAEGLSAKTGLDLGRWGIGKFVFPRSSRVSTHFGLTVRHDDGRRLLMGATTLKAHRIDGDTSVYSPDGLYGEDAAGDFILPLKDQHALDSFCRLFRLTRKDEPGLSVVVPFVDTEITFESLLRSALEDYFFPVLDGRLEISVTAAERTTVLTAASITRVLVENSFSVREGLPAVVRLASMAMDRRFERIALKMPDPARAARWSADLIPAEQLGRLQATLSGGSPIIIRVPVTVRQKRQADVGSWFEVVLVRDKASDGRPVFVREGIVVSDVRGLRAREIRSLVIISDKALATMLGDSENPAHTQWQRDGSNFKGRYTYGPAVINFVSNAVGEIVSVVDHQDEEADSSLTVDYFSIAPRIEPAVTPTSAGSSRRPAAPSLGTEASTDEPLVHGRPVRLRILRENGGFTVSAGIDPPSVPYLVEVFCAYDIRAGNPLRKWSPADFSLGDGGVRISCEGAARPLWMKGNHAVLQIDGPDYRARFSGFDENRDVYVKADIREAGRAHSAD